MNLPYQYITQYICSKTTHRPDRNVATRDSRQWRKCVPATPAYFLTEVMYKFML